MKFDTYLNETHLKEVKDSKLFRSRVNEEVWDVLNSLVSKRLVDVRKIM